MKYSILLGLYLRYKENEVLWIRSLKKTHSFSTLSKQVWSEEEINFVNLCLHINWRRSHLAPLIMSLTGQNPIYPQKDANWEVRLFPEWRCSYFFRIFSTSDFVKLFQDPSSDLSNFDPVPSSDDFVDFLRRRALDDSVHVRKNALQVRFASEKYFSLWTETAQLSKLTKNLSRVLHFGYIPY